MTYSMELETPIGPLTVTATKKAVTAIRFGTGGPGGLRTLHRGGSHSLLRKAAEEIGGVFRRLAAQIHAAPRPRRVAFQQKVWEAAHHPLRRNPHLQTDRHPDRLQPVVPGRRHANNRNPIVIVVPCHRVIGYDGRSSRICRGLDVKEQLLALEKR